MAYYDVSLLARDQDFMSRVTACYQIEEPTDINPQQWMADHIWQIAAAPGFGDKYSYALETGVENPGRVQQVISDSEILSAVQAVTNAPA